MTAASPTPSKDSARTLLLRYIAKELLVNQNDARKALNVVIAGIIEGLTEGRILRFPEFGTFVIKDVPAANGRNPRTGEPLQVAAYKKPSFRPSQALKCGLNPHKNPNQKSKKAKAKPKKK